MRGPSSVRVAGLEAPAAVSAGVAALALLLAPTAPVAASGNSLTRRRKREPVGVMLLTPLRDVEGAAVITLAPVPAPLEGMLLRRPLISRDDSIMLIPPAALRGEPLRQWRGLEASPVFAASTAGADETLLAAGGEPAAVSFVPKALGLTDEEADAVAEEDAEG